MFNFEQAVWVLGVDDDFNSLHASTRSMVRTPHLIESHLATIEQGGQKQLCQVRRIKEYYVNQLQS